MSSDIQTDSRPTMARLLERLGGIDPDRVLLDPTPGTATETDLLLLTKRYNRLYELVEGTLVEKAMGYPESTLASWISHLLWNFLATNNLGELCGADGTLRLMKGLVRLPDVAFIRREQFPEGPAGRAPLEQIPDFAPDLAIEVLSPSNTRGEMQRKRKEYFLAGTTLVWEVDPRRRVVDVYTAPEVSVTLTEADTLDGGDVLPGLQLPVRQIFERLPLPETPTPRRPRQKKPKA